jgi:hypothetical protein
LKRLLRSFSGMCKTQEHVARIAVQQFPMGYPCRIRRCAGYVAAPED